MAGNLYRRLPAAVEAKQWDGSMESQGEIVTWSNGRVSGWFDTVYFLSIDTIDSTARADVGDWIIKGTHGEFYPCKDDIFHEIYELMEVGRATDPARDLIARGITAMHLTRQYVGEELLPEKPGWSWFDWVSRAELFLYGNNKEW